MKATIKKAEPKYTRLSLSAAIIAQADGEPVYAAAAGQSLESAIKTLVPLTCPRDAATAVQQMRILYGVDASYPCEDTVCIEMPRSVAETIASFIGYTVTGVGPERENIDRLYYALRDLGITYREGWDHDHMSVPQTRVNFK